MKDIKLFLFKATSPIEKPVGVTTDDLFRIKVFCTGEINYANMERENEIASRIVACFNAFHGIEDPEKLIESAKKDKIWHQRAVAFLAEKGLQDQFYQWVDKQQQ